MSKLVSNQILESIGISNKTKPRGRPKGSKSKKSGKRYTRKRALQRDGDTKCINEPSRKKRKPNKSHREAFPDHSDEDIRRQLALERKAKIENQHKNLEKEERGKNNI